MGVVVEGVQPEMHTPKLVPRPSDRGVLDGGHIRGTVVKELWYLLHALVARGETNKLKNFDRNQTKGN